MHELDEVTDKKVITWSKRVVEYRQQVTGPKDLYSNGHSHRA